jgi:UDP-glucose 4-epimerase
VREIVREVETESGKSLAVIEKPRRVGDAPHLVSDCSRAKNQLGWQTRHSDLANIVSSAWRWHTRPLAEAPEG